MKNLAITLSLLATLAFARISAQDAAAYVQQTVSDEQASPSVSPPTIEFDVLIGDEQKTLTVPKPKSRNDAFQMVARIWSELNLVVDYNTDMLRRDIFNKIGVASNESSWAVLTNTDDIVAIVNISIYKEDTLVPYYYADGSIVEAAKNFLLRMGLGLADNIVPAYETMQSAIEAAQATIVRHEFDHPVEGTKAIVDIPKYASQNIAYFLVKALADTFKGHENELQSFAQKLADEIVEASRRPAAPEASA